MDEWDVLKAHARAQCATVKDRMWCEVALALGEAARAMERTLGPATSKSDGYFTRTAKDYEAIRKAAAAAEMQRQAAERAERRASKAAKQAAREERKRMRRDGGGYAKPYKPSFAAFYARHELQSYARRLWIARQMGTRSPIINAELRANIRDAELRYAIACAEAGAVPGGRVH